MRRLASEQYALPDVVSGEFIPEKNSGKGLYPVLAYLLDETRREVSIRNSSSEVEISEDELSTILSQTADRLGFDLTPHERDEILAHLEKDQRVFGVLQELVDNPQVSDIIVTSYGKIAVQQGRKNFQTSLSFPNQPSYEAFVERLLTRAGTSYSTKQPIADGMVGSYARVHAVHKSICESGPYLTIRLNRFERVCIDDLVQAELAPRPLFQYLQGIVHAGFTVLVAGEVGTGKTTLSRALCNTIPENESILVIEDTPEIRLEHPHVRYMTTREENLEGAGKIKPSQCIRAGMRMAMNRIIFGEIRDAEAAESFIDVCASGHPGISTVHARSALEAVGRLELFLSRAQPGVSKTALSEQVVTAVQVIVHLALCKDTGRRRVMEVKEIGPIADGVVRQRSIFEYKYKEKTPHWRIPTRSSAYREEIEKFCALHELPLVLTCE